MKDLEWRVHMPSEPDEKHVVRSKARGQSIGCCSVRLLWWESVDGDKITKTSNQQCGLLNSIVINKIMVICTSYMWTRDLALDAAIAFIFGEMKSPPRSVGKGHHVEPYPRSCVCLRVCVPACFQYRWAWRWWTSILKHTPMCCFI